MKIGLNSLLEFISKFDVVIYFGNKIQNITYHHYGSNNGSYFLYKIFSEDFNEILIKFTFTEQRKHNKYSFLKVNIKDKDICDLVLIEDQNLSDLCNKITYITDKHNINFVYISIETFIADVNKKNFRSPLKILKGGINVQNITSDSIHNDSFVSSNALIYPQHYPWESIWNIQVVFKVMLANNDFSEFVINSSYNEIQKKFDIVYKTLEIENKILKLQYKDEIKLIKQLYETKNFNINYKYEVKDKLIDFHNNILEILNFVEKNNEENPDNNFIYEFLLLFRKYAHKKTHNIVSYNVYLHQYSIDFIISEDVEISFSYHLSKQHFDNLPIFKNLFDMKIPTKIIDHLTELELS